MLSHLVNYFLDTFDRSKSHGETFARSVFRFVLVYRACWKNSETSDIDTIHEFVSHDSAADQSFRLWCLLLSSLCPCSGSELVVYRYHCRSCSADRRYRVLEIQQYHRPYGYSQVTITNSSAADITGSYNAGGGGRFNVPGIPTALNAPPALGQKYDQTYVLTATQEDFGYTTV